MVHIVFQEADIEVLQTAITLDPSLEGEVVQIRDDFAVGPLKDLDTAGGWTERENWWLDQLNQSPYAKDHLMNRFDDRETVNALKQQLDDNQNEVVWIWMGQNQHDVCSYYWIISQLRPYQGRIFILYLNNLPFINEKGQIFYPTALHQIQPKEFLKAKKLHRVVTPGEFEVDPDEWARLISENALIRILEGGKRIVSATDDFYDKAILAGLTHDWQKGNRAMHSIFSKMKITTGDLFLLTRIRRLLEQGEVELMGDPVKGWKEFELRLRTGDADATPGKVVAELDITV